MKRVLSSMKAVVASVVQTNALVMEFRAVREVQLRKCSGLMEVIKGIVDQGQQIGVLYGDLVESLEINAGVKKTILLSYEDESCPCWGRCLQPVSRGCRLPLPVARVWRGCIAGSWAEWHQRSTIIRAMRGEQKSIPFAEDWGLVVVLGRDKGQVYGLGRCVFHQCCRGQGGTKTMGETSSAPGMNFLLSPLNLRVVPAEPWVS